MLIPINAIYLDAGYPETQCSTLTQAKSDALDITGSAPTIPASCAELDTGEAAGLVQCVWRMVQSVCNIAPSLGGSWQSAPPTPTQCGTLQSFSCLSYSYTCHVPCCGADFKCAACTVGRGPVPTSATSLVRFAAVLPDPFAVQWRDGATA